MDKKSFGKRMQKYRELLGYSQESLAETIGCSTIFISYMERGEKSPSLDELENYSPEEISKTTLPAHYDQKFH